MQRRTVQRRRAALPLVSIAIFIAACTSTPPANPTSPSPVFTSAPSGVPSAAPSPTSQRTAGQATPVPAPPSQEPAALELAKADTARAEFDPDAAVAAASAVNAFGLDLYRELAARDGNLMVSPTSIATALGMARAGARGDTATELDEVLYEAASKAHAGWLNSLDLALAQRSGTYTDSAGLEHAVSLELANALFGQSGLPLEPAFLEILARRYGAGMYQVDFAGNPEAARLLIDEWASDQTHGRIPEVLKPGQVTAGWRLALVNALYLKAPWLQPFDADLTTAEPFTTADGAIITVPTMHARTGSCATGDAWQAARLGYLGGMDMLVIVPDKLAAFERTFDADRLAAIRDAFDAQSATAEVSLPRFDVEMRAELSPELKRLGLMTTLDPGRSDFTGMTTAERLGISEIIHQANMTVDEQGTEAAAVTVIGLDTAGGGDAQRCIVRADHPFIVAIEDETGAILFLGRIADPAHA